MIYSLPRSMIRQFKKECHEFGKKENDWAISQKVLDRTIVCPKCLKYASNFIDYSFTCPEDHIFKAFVFDAMVLIRANNSTWNEYFVDGKPAKAIQFKRRTGWEAIALW